MGEGHVAYSDLERMSVDDVADIWATIDALADARNLARRNRDTKQ